VAGLSYLLSQSKPSHAEFNPALHIARGKLRLTPGNWPLFVGISYDDGIAASCIAQVYNAEVRIFFAAVSEGISLRRHLSENVVPWLTVNNTPGETLNARLSVLGAYERETPEQRKESNLWETIAETFGTEQGAWSSISKPWEVRRDSMLNALSESLPFTFKPRLQFDPRGTQVLSQALSGRVYDKTQAEKKSYHIINAFSLLLARLELWKMQPKAKPPRPVGSWMSA
jgi:hypothetical protein